MDTNAEEVAQKILIQGEGPRKLKVVFYDATPTVAEIDSSEEHVLKIDPNNYSLSTMSVPISNNNLFKLTYPKTQIELAADRIADLEARLAEIEARLQALEGE